MKRPLSAYLLRNSRQPYPPVFSRIFDDCSQLVPAAFPCIHDLAQWHRLAGQVGRYSAAKKSLAVEDPDLAHVPGIKPDRDVFTDVSCHERRATE